MEGGWGVEKDGPNPAAGVMPTSPEIMPEQNPTRLNLPLYR